MLMQRELSELTIRDVVRDCLERGIVDPEKIAGIVERELPAATIASMLRNLLIERCREIVRSVRRHTYSEEQNVATSSARWKNIADPRKQAVGFADGSWCKLEDMTAEQCQRHAEWYFNQADTMRERGRVFEALAKECNKRKVATVGKLPKSVLLKIWVR